MDNQNTQITKYDNRLNSISLSTLNSMEINIFFMALTEVINKDESEVTLNYSDIAEITGLAKTSPAYMFDLLKTAKEKIGRLNLNVFPDQPYVDDTIWLFSRWRNDKLNKTLTLSFSEHYLWLINGVKSNFTAFECRELMELKGKCAKNLFAHLKQWKTVGTYSLSSDRVRDVLGVPESCPDRNIFNKYVAPAVEEIKSKGRSFSDIDVKTVVNGKNHKVIGYDFTWTPENVVSVKKTSQHIACTEAIKYQAENDVLSVKDYDKLVKEFGQDIVDEIINRIMTNNYEGCLNTYTIRKWCKERIDVPTGFAELDEYFDDTDELKAAFGEYIDVRKQMGLPITSKIVSFLMSELCNLSCGNNDKALTIIKKASASGWRSFYPVDNLTSKDKEGIITKWETA